MRFDENVHILPLSRVRVHCSLVAGFSRAILHYRRILFSFVSVCHYGQRNLQWKSVNGRKCNFE